MGTILEKETFEKFGYKIEDLKPNSCKIVIWRCDSCNTIYEKKYVAAKKFTLCLNCSNKKIANESREILSRKITEYFRTHEHPLKGTKRPQHVVDALKKANIGRKMSDEQKKYYSERYSGEGNPFYGKKHTEDTLERLRQIQSKNPRRGKKSNFYGRIYHGKGSFYIKKDGSKIWMRSSWEIKYARHLDNNQVEWYYEPRPFEIIINGVEQTYTPDFFLPKENIYVEIKGYWRDDALTKFNAFKERYPEICIQVLMKADLQKIGVEDIK